jgi:hypothetical protein
MSRFFPAKNSGGRWWLALLLASATSLAVGAETPVEKTFPPWDRGALRLGGFVAGFDSTLGFGLGGGAAGIEINAEDLLGMESSLTVFRADGLYRFGETRRHRLDLTYASYERSANKVLTDQIEIDGEILAPGTAIESVFDFDLYRLSYTYSIFMDERVNIGVGLGVYVAPVTYGVDITTPGDTRELEIRDVTLPLPAFALRGDLKLTPKVSLYGEMDLLYLELGGFAGALMDLRIGGEYQFTEHFGLGLGYNFFNLDVEAEGSASDYPTVDFFGAINVRFTGLLLYAKVSF